MKISLIMATVNRTLEVETFLRHLDRQEYRDFELIVVDQNEDDRLASILLPYGSRFTIVHLASERGISKARNVGLLRASGDLIAFPDDDCWYGPDLLRSVVARFAARPDADIVTGRSIDGTGADSASKFDKTEGPVDRKNVWRRAISYTIFQRRNVGVLVGGFDENIGVGANSIYLSGEETDYVLRALPHCRAYYYPDLTVYHPSPVARYSPQVIKRAYKYGCGFGKVVAKHRYSLPYKGTALLKPIVGSILYGLFLQFPKSNYYWHSFLGRLRGML
ncbi:glycosyltransferase family 2 protein [Cohnella soli]|uniref:Glycosyltransferase family 2 protein n=1 Tax=Cohnella soli TaxID=425005 RepID=A0ABW0HXS8_9BACL